MDTNQNKPRRSWLQLDHVYKNNIPTSANARSQKRNNPLRPRVTPTRLYGNGKTLELHPTKGWR